MQPRPSCPTGTPAIVRAGIGCTGAVPLVIAAFGRRRLSLGCASAVQHHRRVLLLAHSGHQRGRILEALAVGGEDLSEEVDVAAEGDHAVVVVSNYRPFLLLSYRP